MKVMKVLTIVAITGMTGITALNAESATTANSMQQTSKGMKQHPGNQQQNMMKILKELNLTAEQKTKLRESNKKLKMQSKEMRKEMKAGRSMEQYITAKGFAKDEFIRDATEKSTKMIQMRADRFDAIATVLTPEQREKLVKLLKNKKK